MRRLGGSRALALASVIAFAAGGCKRREIIETQKTEEAPATLASVLHMGDPASSAQLVRGFHSIEGNSWRWTMGAFAVTLRPPLDSGRQGAKLIAKFSIPDAVISRVHSMTLSAKAGGVPLPPETYTRSGEYTYERDVPASALKAEAVACEFALDRYLPPGGGDLRELGLVMNSIGLEGK